MKETRVHCSFSPPWRRLLSGLLILLADQPTLLISAENVNGLSMDLLRYSQVIWKNSVGAPATDDGNHTALEAAKVYI
jgi:hypothetical protein